MEALYPAYLNREVNTNRRLSSLVHISQFIREQYPKIYEGTADLKNTDSERLMRYYKEWKGKDLNGAEKNVFSDFYKLSRM